MKLHTLVTGDGPATVALIHGLGGNADMWTDLAERIAADGRYTVLAPDLRGHGDSPRAGSYRIEEFIDDLVETLPAELDAAVGHSLGGALLVRAVPRLAPGHAVYLDPGFRLGLPSHGIGAKLFWGLSGITMPAVALATRLTGTNETSRYNSIDAARVERAKEEWDRSMAVSVFRQLTFDPTPHAPPVVPSTVVLSSEGSVVVPDPLPQQLSAVGWDIRRLPSVGHPFWLHDADATYETIRDVL